MKLLFRILVYLSIIIYSANSYSVTTRHYDSTNLRILTTLNIAKADVFVLATGNLNSNRSQSNSNFQPGNNWNFQRMPGQSAYVCPDRYYAYFYYAINNTTSGGGDTNYVRAKVKFCLTSSGNDYMGLGEVVNHTSAGSNGYLYVNFTVYCIRCPLSGCPRSTDDCNNGHGRVGKPGAIVVAPGAS